jgi:hypothetical protein
MIYDLVTASWGYQDKVSEPLMSYINLKRCSGQFLQYQYMVFIIQFATQGVEKLSDGSSIFGFSHEPEGGAIFFWANEKVLSRRTT